MTGRFIYSLLLMVALLANLATAGLVSAAMAVELPTMTAVAADTPCHLENPSVVNADHSCHHDCLDCLFSTMIDSGSLSSLLPSTPELKFAEHQAAFIPHDPEHINPPPIASLT